MKQPFTREQRLHALVLQVVERSEPYQGRMNVILREQASRLDGTGIPAEAQMVVTLSMLANQIAGSAEPGLIREAAIQMLDSLVGERLRGGLDKSDVSPLIIRPN